MISLELDDEDQYEAVPAMPGMDKPRFPYGTRISLENAQLSAVKLSPDDCTVGGVIHLHALARITSVSQNDTDSGKRERVELQIESMCCVESEDSENDAAEEEMEGEEPLSSRRGKLYDRTE